MKVLYSCVGNHDPGSTDPDNAGPIIAAALSLRPDAAILLATADGFGSTPTEQNGRETARKLEGLGFKSRLVLLPFTDPTDVNAIFPEMLEKTLAAKEEIEREAEPAASFENLVVATSGTPQMQLAMMLLADTVLIPAKLYQVARPSTPGKSGMIRGTHDRVTKFDLLVMKRIELRDRLLIAVRSGHFSSAAFEIENYLDRHFPDVSGGITINSPFLSDRALPALRGIFLSYEHCDNLGYDAARRELDRVHTSVFSPEFQRLVADQIIAAGALFASQTSGYELLDLHASAVRRFNRGALVDCIIRAAMVYEELLKQRARALKVLPRRPEEATIKNLKSILSNDAILRELHSTPYHGGTLLSHLNDLNRQRNGCIHETQPARRRYAKASVKVTDRVIVDYFRLCGGPVSRPDEYCFHPARCEALIEKELKALWAVSGARSAKA